MSSERPDAPRYPSDCAACPDSEWAGDAGDRRLECRFGIGAEVVAAPTVRAIPEGDEPPAWCPRDLGAVDRSGYPSDCVGCEYARYRLASTSGPSYLVCCEGVGSGASREERLIPSAIVGAHPFWCPLDPGTEDKPELSEGDALAMVLYMLFGPNAAEEIEDGGYVRYHIGGRSPGILEQIDKRLIRIEEELGLDPISFVIGDDDSSVARRASVGFEPS